MSMTTRDAQALTYLAGRLREETKGAAKWDEHGTYSVVSQLVGQHLATSIERVIRHASDFDAKTPGAINRPFLPAASVPAKRTGPPKKHEECRTHVGQYADNCGGCRSDDLAVVYEDEESEPLPRVDATTGPAACRAALKETP